MTYLAILGKTPKLSLAELIAKFSHVQQIAPHLATFKTPKQTAPNINHLGGALKIAEEISISPLEILQNCPKNRLVFGISDYSPTKNSAKLTKTALFWKKTLKNQQKSVRIINSQDGIIPTATAHHNQLGEKLGHFEFIFYKNRVFVSLGSQNITAYTKRDQARPARDAKNGMLPPKLAQILINLAGNLPPNSLILDPFCGSGVILQEALLMGYRASGSDLNPIMVKKTTQNLTWLEENYLKIRPNANLSPKLDYQVSVGDATTHQWSPSPSAVVCETYLGTPFGAPPSNLQLSQLKQDIGSLILHFLKNLHPQITPDTPVVLALPAWLRPDGTYQSLNLLDDILKIGYNVIKYQDLGSSDLIYYRQGQIVAREIISLRK